MPFTTMNLFLILRPQLIRRTIIFNTILILEVLVFNKFAQVLECILCFVKFASIVWVSSGPWGIQSTCYAFICLLIIAQGILIFEACDFYISLFEFWALEAYTCMCNNFFVPLVVCHFIQFLEFGDLCHLRLQFCMLNKFKVLTNIFVYVQVGKFCCNIRQGLLNQGSIPLKVTPNS